MSILLTDEDPCVDCPNKVDDTYGRFCDLACGKHSTYLIKKGAYEAQLKKAVSYIRENVFDIDSKGNIHWRADARKNWYAMIDEVSE